jgi:hypothetical protein
MILHKNIHSNSNQEWTTHIHGKHWVQDKVRMQTRATLGTTQGTKANKAKTQHRKLKLCVTRTPTPWKTNKNKTN